MTSDIPSIPIVKPDLGDAEVEAASRVIRSGWLAQGPEVAAFERELATAVGAAHAVAVANCTVALELALRALGIGRGDDVLTVSHSFVATANAVIAVGGRPVFVDVESETLGMDPRRLADALTPGTKAVLCVHQVGMPCDLDGILAFADAHGLPVIEDAACAIGSEIWRRDRWERIGRPHGVVACFSFHPRKVVTTGDGGMLTTTDPALAARFRSLRQHGLAMPDVSRQGDRIVFEDHAEPGFNYRMTDLAAAIGRPQLARLGDILAARRTLAQRYAAALADHPWLIPPRERPSCRSNWQSYPVALAPGGPSQREVLMGLLDRGVAAKRGVHNAHQERAYANAALWTCGPTPCGLGHDGRCGRLATSERLRDETVLLPLYHGMTPAEQDAVIGACRALARRGRSVSS